jgi:hypothetical protein
LRDGVDVEITPSRHNKDVYSWRDDMNGKWSLASRAPLALCLTMALISLTGCPADEPSTNNDTKDLCAQVTCDAPPASSCDGDNAVTYAATGTCDATDGMCDYAEAARTNCADSGQLPGRRQV